VVWRWALVVNRRWLAVVGGGRGRVVVEAGSAESQIYARASDRGILSNGFLAASSNILASPLVRVMFAKPGHGAAAAAAALRCCCLLTSQPLLLSPAGVGQVPALLLRAAPLLPGFCFLLALRLFSTSSALSCWCWPAVCRTLLVTPNRQDG
jgi:hypothetical protein